VPGRDGTDGPRLLRLAPSAALKEKRLAALLEGRPAEAPRLLAAVRQAQAAGSLGLSGIAATPGNIEALLRAQAEVDERAPFTASAVLAWHRAVTGSPAGWRTAERTRDGGPPPAPAEFVATRLQNLEHWLNVESSADLKPAQQGALVLARMAASHVMVRAGARPPVWTAEDRLRLAHALPAAFQLQTEPLASLLDDAVERALDVMIRTLEA
jgi:hypothetical protein